MFLYYLKPSIFKMIACIFLFQCQISYAFSKYGVADGMALITIKNGYPCFYLSDSSRIIDGIHIKNVSESAETVVQKIITKKVGNNRNNCLPYGNVPNEIFKYNTPYIVWLDDNIIDDYKKYHYTDFCINKNHKKIKLTKTRKAYFWENGNKKCTNDSWSPIKR